MKLKANNARFQEEIVQNEIYIGSSIDREIILLTGKSDILSSISRTNICSTNIYILVFWGYVPACKF